MPDIFNETLYEAEVTRRTGRTQQQRREAIDAVVDRHLSRWSGRPYPNTSGTFTGSENQAPASTEKVNHD